MSGDHELLVAWRDGDSAAGNALVQRHYASIYNFFRSKTADAYEELTQRTFIACVHARDRIDDRGSVKAYLFGIARRQLIGYFREFKRARDRLDPMQTSVADMAGTPSQVVAQHEEQQRLVAAMREIPLDLQIVLELFYWEDLAVADIAGALEIPPGTVKSRLFRARELLRERLLAGGASADACETTLSGLPAERLERLR